MIAIIQCSGSKYCTGHFTTASNNPVSFCNTNPFHPQRTCYYPWDISDMPPHTWIDRVHTYNGAGGNSHAFLPAISLYKPKIYRDLEAWIKKSSANREVYILSAGWGLVRSSFLLPCYDLTFAKGSARIKGEGHFPRLLCHIKNNPQDVHVFITPNYYALFGYFAKKACISDCTLYFRPSKSNESPKISEFKGEYCSFSTSRRTNWHESAARQHLGL